MRIRRTVWITAGIAVLAAAATTATAAAGWWTGGTTVVTNTASANSAGANTALSELKAGRCPTKQPGTPVSDVAGTGDSMVPIAADRVLLCAYAGLDPGPGVARYGLATEAVVTDPAKISDLRNVLNSLGNEPNGTYNCPEATGASVLEIFGDGAHEVEVNQTLDGCQAATNGSRARGVGTSAADGILLSLLPPASCTSIWNRSAC
jgi:hypothetical protein